MPTRKYQMKISEPTRSGGRTVMRYRPAVDIDARHLIEGAAVFYYEHGRLPDTKVMLIEHTMETVLAKGLRYFDNPDPRKESVTEAATDCVRRLFPDMLHQQIGDEAITRHAKKTKRSGVEDD